MSSTLNPRHRLTQALGLVLDLVKTYGDVPPEYAIHLTNLFYDGANAALRASRDGRGEVTPDQAQRIMTEVVLVCEPANGRPPRISEPYPGTIARAALDRFGTLEVDWKQKHSLEELTVFYIGAWSFMRALMGHGTTVNPTHLRMLTEEVSSRLRVRR